MWWASSREGRQASRTVQDFIILFKFGIDFSNRGKRRSWRFGGNPLLGGRRTRDTNVKGLQVISVDSRTTPGERDDELD